MIHHPKTRDEWLTLRHKYVCSTDQAALHGLSPYQTAFELFHAKSAETYTEWEAGERAEWGIALEEAVARKVAEDQGVKVRKLSAFVSRDGTGMASSFDYEIVGLKEEYEGTSALRVKYAEQGPGILEIKCVDWLVFKQSWPEYDDSREAPAHIEIQVQHQLHCIERQWAALGVLVGGNRLHLLTRDYDAEVAQSLEAATKRFWKDVAAKRAPPPVLPADAELIAAMYSFGDPDKVLDAQENMDVFALCEDYINAAAQQSAAEKTKTTAKAKLLMMIGDASKVICGNGITISAGTVGEAVVETYTRKAYRNFRVNKKVPKEAA